MREAEIFYVHSTFGETGNEVEMSRGVNATKTGPINYQKALFTYHALPCPECRDTRGVVIDSKQSRDGTEIRRRRMCFNRHRFTTRERINERLEPAEIISGIFLP